MTNCSPQGKRPDQIESSERIGTWSAGALILMLIGMALFGCAKDNPAFTVTVAKGSSIPTPYFKHTIPVAQLDLTVRFDGSCLYPTLAVGCAGDWNKLIYFGDINPHDNGAAFVWMHRGGKLELGWYAWINGIKPTISGKWGSIGTFNAGDVITLQIDLSNGVTWRVNGVQVAHLNNTVKGRWVSQGWFGGADDGGGNCGATQRVTYEIDMTRGENR